MTNYQITKEDALGYLRSALCDPNAQFRNGQWEAIKTLLTKRGKHLIVQSTGWGKSIVYFITTKILRNSGQGPTLIISPLLSLMRNQVSAAERLKLSAVTINSSNRVDWKTIEQKIKSEQTDILLISPERLSNEDFKKNILNAISGNIGLFVVDEAHCISDWGHDFRPDYRRLARIVNAIPSNTPVLATTATANNRVIEDIKSQLGDQITIHRGNLKRSSLKLQNISFPGITERMAWLAEHLVQIRGSGIIYTLTVKDCENVSDWLCSQGINAKSYHAKSENREELEQDLLENRLKALVATTALGMGFDKPDLAFVIHFQRPGSVIHYYQQIGRAGRAIAQAYAVLLSGRKDKDITDFFIEQAFPPAYEINEVLKALNDAEDGLSIKALEQQLNCKHSKIENILRFLVTESPQPVVRSGYKWYANPVYYDLDIDRIDRIIALKKAEQDRMSEYLETGGCLMEFLQKELDDPQATPCGKCSNCLGHPLLPMEYSRSLVLKAEEFLRNRPVIVEVRKQWPDEGLKSKGWRGNIASKLLFEPGRALCKWGNYGWGNLVKKGKQEDGFFSEELVDAMVKMVKINWKPEPFPTWLTCVPSLANPNLVPSFAKRLAGKLRLRFIPCIRKIRDTEPQKLMSNSYRQVNNLDGAFQINGEIPKGPVFLVDDMVDSRWTMTVLSALLKDAGSGPVYPLTLSITTSK